jgi:hypothetical protein
VEAVARLDAVAVSLQENAPWNPRAVEATERQIEAALFNSGYPEGRVITEVDTSEPGHARVAFVVEPGRYVVIGDVVIAGLRRTRRSVVDRMLREAGVSAEHRSRDRVVDARQLTSSALPHHRAAADARPGAPGVRGLASTARRAPSDRTWWAWAERTDRWQLTRLVAPTSRRRPCAFAGGPAVGNDTLPDWPPRAQGPLPRPPRLPGGLSDLRALREPRLRAAPPRPLVRRRRPAPGAVPCLVPLRVPVMARTIGDSPWTRTYRARTRTRIASITPTPSGTSATTPCFEPAASRGLAEWAFPVFAATPATSSSSAARPVRPPPLQHLGRRHRAGASAVRVDESCR